MHQQRVVPYSVPVDADAGTDSDADGDADVVNDDNGCDASADRNDCEGC